MMLSGMPALPVPMCFEAVLDSDLNLRTIQMPIPFLRGLRGEASDLSSRTNGMSRVVVELADRPHLRERGFMFRDRLDDGSGMAFLFDHPQRLSFWGMNTLIPLDIAFVNSSGSIVSTGRIKPHDLTSVASAEPCTMAVELPDGWLSKNGFRVGDECHLNRDDSPPCCIFARRTKFAQTKPALNSVDPEPVDEDAIPKVEADVTDIAKNPTPPAQAEPPPDQRTEVSSVPARQGADSAVSQLPVPDFDGVGGAVMWGVSNQQSMTIEYRNKRGEVRVHNIEPHSMHFSEHSRRQVVAAWDEVVGAPRNFLMTNIVRYSFPGRTFTRKFVVA